MIASTLSPIRSCRMMVASSIQGTGDQKCRSRRLMGRSFSSTTALGPNSANLCAASALDKPNPVVGELLAWEAWTEVISLDGAVRVSQRLYRHATFVAFRQAKATESVSELAQK